MSNYTSEYLSPKLIYSSSSEFSESSNSSNSSSENFKGAEFTEKFSLFALNQMFKKVGAVKILNMLLNRNFDLDLFDEIYDEVNLICEKEVPVVNLFFKRVEKEIDDRDVDVREVIDTSWTYRYFKSEGLQRNQVAHDFEVFSTTIARIIIEEFSLPDYLKTILPINIGGIAGGEKYLWNGILFKMSKDVKLGNNLWLYGGQEPNDELANKALSCEIKALKALYTFLEKNEDITNIRYSLMNKITYLGLTLSAATLLPVRKDTLIYGSDNAGKTYGESDPQLNIIVDRISEYFNLMEHPVIDMKQKIFMIKLAADVEIHKVGSEYYVLDFGRFLPTNDSQMPFSKYFRSEYITNPFLMGENKLSCDAFTNFSIEREKYNAYSISQIEKLDSLVRHDVLNHFIDKDDRLLLTNTNIREMLHQIGINLRYMGTIRYSALEKYFDTKDTKYLLISNYLLEEMILRSTKSFLQRQSKKIQCGTVLSSYSEIKLVMLSLSYNIKPNSDYFGSDELKNEIMSKYGNLALLDTEKLAHFNLVRAIEKYSPVIEFYYYYFPRMQHGNEKALNFYDSISSLSNIQIEVIESLGDYYQQYYDFEFDHFRDKMIEYSNFHRSRTVMCSFPIPKAASLMRYVANEKTELDMYHSIIEGKETVLQTIIEYHPSFVDHDKYLLLACKQERVSDEIIKTLLYFGSNPNEQRDEFTCFFYLLMNCLKYPIDNFLIVQKFIKQGPPDISQIYDKVLIDGKEYSNISALHIVALIDRTEYWELFASTYLNIIQASYLDLLIFKSQNYFQNFLNEKYFHDDVPSHFLLKLVELGDLESLIFYLGSGVQYDLNTIKTDTGATCLYLAAKNGHMNILRYLIEQTDADLTACRIDGMGPIHVACATGMNDILIELFHNNADLNLRDNTRRTPVFYAAFYGHLETVEILAENSVDLYVKDIYGQTPFMMSCYFGHSDLAKYFIDRCASKKDLLDLVDLQDRMGQSIMQLAYLNNKIDIINLLEESIKNFNVIHSEFKYPINIDTVIIPQEHTENQVILEGYFIKRGGIIRNWKKRYFKISKSIVTYHISETEETLGFFHISSITSVQRSGRRKGRQIIQICTPDRTYCLYPEDKRLDDVWYDTLKSLIHKK